MSKTDPLSPLRQKIDDIDERLLALLNDRARIVQEIGKIKKEQKADFYAPSREQAIYDRLTQLNPGPFPNEAVRSVFREIISASLSLEGPVKVAYLGPRATFTHLACMQRFGFSITDLPVGSIKEVFDEVERGRADFGVVPIENSTEGVVNHTLDLFVDSPLKIFGEILLEVSHHLLSKTGKIEDLRRIYSHSHAIAQCKNFLESHLPQVQVVEVSSTARAAEMAQEDPSAGAIASELAAKLYHLIIIKKRIEDNIHNFTRFLVVSQKDHHRTGRDKTSVMFSIKDKVGALYEMLHPFSEQQINLTKIESRPSKKKAWEYIFYIDLVGHIEDEKIRTALEGLKNQAVFLKVLGSYPMAEKVKN
ncbi:MAG TPA: prephenate dehydratase [Candidatus Manganitrophaceae bacterium]|nr:prephenate dehydratase [Candidatus Manganitrophaceae bacterium]